MNGHRKTYKKYFLDDTNSLLVNKDMGTQLYMFYGDLCLYCK